MLLQTAELPSFSWNDVLSWGRLEYMVPGEDALASQMCILSLLEDKRSSSETTASFTWNQTRRLSGVPGPLLLPGV